MRTLPIVTLTLLMIAVLGAPVKAATVEEVMAQVPETASLKAEYDRQAAGKPYAERLKILQRLQHERDMAAGGDTAALKKDYDKAAAGVKSREERAKILRKLQSDQNKAAGGDRKYEQEEYDRRAAGVESAAERRKILEQLKAEMRDKRVKEIGDKHGVKDNRSETDKVADKTCTKKAKWFNRAIGNPFVDTTCKKSNH